MSESSAEKWWRENVDPSIPLIDIPKGENDKRERVHLQFIHETITMAKTEYFLEIEKKWIEHLASTIRDEDIAPFLKEPK